MTIITEDILEEFRSYVPRGTVASSVTWFRKKVQSLGLGSTQPRALLNGSDIGRIGPMLIGNIYLFEYDAKTKEELPYWDTFPLVLPFQRTPTGFLGLNLHYLYPLHRMELLLALLTLGRRGGNTQKSLKVTYQILSNYSKFKWVGPCIKQYILTGGHVKNSRFLKINFEDWKTIISLPLERFVHTEDGRNTIVRSTRVHEDSRRRALTRGTATP